jgi:ribosomal protein L37AE/L43A
MWPFRRLLDDAERPVRTFRPEWGNWALHLPPDQFREIQATLRLECEGQPRPLMSLSWYVVMTLVMAVVMGVYRAEAMLGLAAMGVLAGFWIYRYRRGFPTRNRFLIARALLDRRRCASCAHSLHGVPRDKEGLTQCPECGASWRLGSVMSATPIH